MIDGSPRNLDTPQISYLYDGSGHPYAGVYRDLLTQDAKPQVFFVICNQRGDVIELLDGAGRAIVSYRYDI